MSRLRPLAIALVAAAALFVVACDGDTAEKNDYVDEVNEVQNTLQSDISKLAQTPAVTRAAGRVLRRDRREPRVRGRLAREHRAAR